ncbi:MAG: MIP/aquaporin family protein [Candidatus Nanopelagicales bacterium]|nr:MIP/aquaporin family protein [Candidatus Nanopelagicales bacterium]
MIASDLPRRIAAELIGAGLLVAAVVGSGIMATQLTGDVGLELLINALATTTALGVLIWTLGPISGAHFNPAVTLVAAVRKEVRVGESVCYVLAQCVGAMLGVALANIMFELPAWQAAERSRVSFGALLGEVVATAGLLWVIGALTRSRHGHLGPVLVPAWIGAAYFFTASTSFANPAVTLGRGFSDSFAGIAPSSIGPFVLAQFVGAGIGALLTEYFHPRRGTRPEPLDLPDPIHEARGEHS